MKKLYDIFCSFDFDESGDSCANKTKAIADEDVNLLETSTKRLQLPADLPGIITGQACKIKTAVLNVNMQYAGEQQFLLLFPEQTLGILHQQSWIKLRICSLLDLR